MCKHLYNRDTQHSLQGHQGPSSNTGILKSIRAHDSSSERLNLTVTGLRRRGLKVIPRSHVYPLKRRKARKQRAQVTLTNYVSEWILKDMAVIPRKQKHSKVVCSFASELDTAQRGDSLPWGLRGCTEHSLCDRFNSFHKLLVMLSVNAPHAFLPQNMGLSWASWFHHCSFGWSET